MRHDGRVGADHPATAVVDVWLRRVVDVPPGRELLDRHERAVLAGLAIHAAASAYAAGHVLLRRAVADVVGSTPGALCFDRACSVCGGQHGRPVLRDDLTVSVSLSHTVEVVAVAVTRSGPVGIDVETDVGADFDGYAQMALHEDERASVEDPAPGRARRRTVAWVRKEAALKALGVGLRHDPSRLPAPTTSTRTTIDGVGDVVVVDLAVPWAGTSAAVAVSGPLDGIDVRLR